MAIYRNQAGNIRTAFKNRFFLDVMRGLNSRPKFLQSKYFYDAAGDKLFQQIMQCPEYYLTGCELEIFSRQTKNLAQVILDGSGAFDIVELGSGDATKSGHLLKYLVEQEIDFTYFPVDISENVINQLETDLPVRIPGLKVTGLNGEYLEMIEQANHISKRRKLVLLLGSNIGNFSTREAGSFLTSCREHMQPGDLLMTGFDLKKDPRQILQAYNDASGITRKFNLNLLRRINRELGADFNISQFDHYPTYDPVSGSCRSFLISTHEQVVNFPDADSINFSKNEPVYMELSQKYSAEEIDSLAQSSGFETVTRFTDSREWFMDVIWKS
jgi:L-histidine N-alpha-methyltransferase